MCDLALFVYFCMSFIVRELERECESVLNSSWAFQILMESNSSRLPNSALVEDEQFNVVTQREEKGGPREKERTACSQVTASELRERSALDFIQSVELASKRTAGNRRSLVRKFTALNLLT